MSKSLTEGIPLPTSDKQIQANRENAKLSTGPVTPEGKSICSHNAVKTGLTGQTVVLKTDDLDAYHAHVQRFTDKYKPAIQDEKDLVQDIADTEWRLLRITPLENSVLALGRRELAPLFADEADPILRDQLIEAKVFITYQRDFTNLSIQQARLRRHRKSIIEELDTLQAERKKRASDQSYKASKYYRDAVENDWTMQLTDFGSDFTLDDLIESLAQHKSMCERDEHKDVTKKAYREEYRAEFLERFGEQ